MRNVNTSKAPRVVRVTEAMVKATKAATYTRRTSSRRIFVEELGLWLSNPLHVGNLKIGRNVAILSLKEFLTCLNCKDCAPGCYAGKASAAYPSVKAHRVAWSWVAVNDPDLFFRCIIAQLMSLIKFNGRRRVAIDTVRIHEAGDFFCQSYIDGWAMVAALFPGLKFYFYTEVNEMFDFSGLCALPNVNKVSSRMPDGSINFGPADEIKAKAAALGVPVCPCGSPGFGHGDCGKRCTLCHSAPFMAFIQS